MPYWDRVAGTHAALDPLGAVLYPAAPPWFNRFYARFQLAAVEDMLAQVRLRGMRCLDVGCGSGRWSRWLAGCGAEPVGVDPTRAMLDAARRASPEIDFRQMSATQLDFPDESFDFVMSVTVIQHLEPQEQERAAAEMMRVLRRGGQLFVFDLIDQRDPGRQVFPRSPESWINLYQSLGASLQRWKGQEYVPLVRLPAALLAMRSRATATSEGSVAPSVLEKFGRSKVLFLPLLPIILASYPIEKLSEMILPSEWARHGCFLFRKNGGS